MRGERKSVKKIGKNVPSKNETKIVMTARRNELGKDERKKNVEMKSKK